MLDTLFSAERQFGRRFRSRHWTLDISSVFESFDRADKEKTRAISGRILVVDDNDSNRNLLAHQLHRQGHEVSTAPSGRQALKMIRESQTGPDLAGSVHAGHERL